MKAGCFREMKQSENSCHSASLGYLSQIGPSRGRHGSEQHSLGYDILLLSCGSCISLIFIPSALYAMVSLKKSYIVNNRNRYVSWFLLQQSFPDFPESLIVIYRIFTHLSVMCMAMTLIQGYLNISFKTVQVNWRTSVSCMRSEEVSICILVGILHY